MEIGTIEKLEEEDKPKRVRSGGGHRSRQSGGDSGDPGGGGGDNGGGDNRKESDFEEPETIEIPQKSRVLMWFLLLVVLMTFGGLIAAYVVIAKNAALEWRPFALPVQVWVSTALILASSLTYILGKNALKSERFGLSKKLFLITSALGGMFIASQFMAWLALAGRGLYMTGNPYAGFFYILTAVHAVHVLGGICALGYILLKTWEPPASDRNQIKHTTDATVIGWYWHTMDGLWLVLLFLLGYWT